jgi:hypothetical protein
LTFLPAATPIFSYLNTLNPVKISSAYVYEATTTAGQGEQTTPILQLNGTTIGALHTAADGRESLALTFDNNPYLRHSLTLNYGLINWVTKGVFLGARHIYLNPQIDDLFIPNDLYSATPPNCRPAGFLVDPTVDLSANCPTAITRSADLISLSGWQDRIQSNPQTRQFRTTLAFNGIGLDDGNGGVDMTNPLALTASTVREKFFWISHTYNHFNLDCYDPVPNSGICAAATATQAATEIDSNLTTAMALAINVDTQSMITPEISGLNNPAFIQTAFQRGIRFLVMDASTITSNPPPPNTGILNPSNNSVLEIPRRPTSIFYNTISGFSQAAGSLPDEYNYFYGPNGLFRIGGPGGAPFYTTNQTYVQILDSESESLLMDMLSYKANPMMFHQSNLVRFIATNTLYTDLMNLTLQKFAQVSNLPVISLPQNQIGVLFQQRMAYNASGVQALWTPGSPAAITLTSLKPATIPITGFCSTGCENYGGQVIGQVQVTGASPVTILGQ